MIKYCANCLLFIFGVVLLHTIKKLFKGTYACCGTIFNLGSSSSPLGYFSGSAMEPYAESSLVAYVFRIVALVDPLVACVGMQKAYYTKWVY